MGFCDMMPPHRAMPTARGNLNQLAASQGERIGAPNARTATPQPQKARLDTRFTSTNRPSLRRVSGPLSAKH
jgi:hypothetical protein